MEQFNKALSFILGLVVVAVFIVVASGKFNLKGFNLAKSGTSSSTAVDVTPKPTSKPWFSFGSAKPTATPTMPAKKITLTGSTMNVNQQSAQVDPNYHSYSGSNTPTSIPNTGVPIVLFPLFGSSLLTGVFLKKQGKK
jgi:hypothetical protein